MRVGVAEKVFKVKGQGQGHTCTNMCGGIHFDDAASRIACFLKDVLN